MTNLDVLGPKESLIYISSIKKGMYLTSLVHKMTSFYSKGSMMIPFVCIKLYLDIGIDGNVGQRCMFRAFDYIIAQIKRHPCSIVYIDGSDIVINVCH